MLDAWFTNPFTEPDFWSVVLQLLFLFVASLVVTVLLNIQDIRNVFRSKIWNHFLYWQLAIVPFLLTPYFGLFVFLAVLTYLIVRSIDLFCSFLHVPFFYVQVIRLNALISLSVVLLFPTYVSLLPFIYFISCIIFALMNRQLESVMINLSLALLGSIWIVYSTMHFILISYLLEGLQKLIILGVAVAASDFCAYVLSLIYQNRFAALRAERDNLFDKKMMLLSLGGNIIGAFIGVYLLHFIEPDLPLEEEWILSILVGISAFLGKALFDMMRRYVEMKDFIYFSAKPSGVLDRMSLFLIAAVVCYQYLLIFT